MLTEARQGQAGPLAQCIHHRESLQTCVARSYREVPFPDLKMLFNINVTVFPVSGFA